MYSANQSRSHFDFFIGATIDSIWANINGSVGVVVAIIGGSVALFEFRRKRAQELLEERRRQEQRFREFRTKLYDEQRPLYARACTLAATLATAETGLEGARQEFLMLYWGEMCLIEDSLVEQAMIAFRKGLINGATRSELEQLAYELAIACRRSLDVAGIFGVGNLDRSAHSTCNA